MTQRSKSLDKTPSGLNSLNNVFDVQNCVLHTRELLKNLTPCVLAQKNIEHLP